MVIPVKFVELLVELVELSWVRFDVFVTLVVLADELVELTVGIVLSSLANSQLKSKTACPTAVEKSVIPMIKLSTNSSGNSMNWPY